MPLEYNQDLAVTVVPLPMMILHWDIKRKLTKINYRIHTDAIKENLVPENLSAQQINFCLRQ